MHAHANLYNKCKPAQSGLYRVLLVAVIIIFLVAVGSVAKRDSDSGDLADADKLAVIQTSNAYPTDMVKLAETYPQTIDYVYNYPELRDKTYPINLTKEAKDKSVPLLMQWDERWGYSVYGNGLIGYTGCGPVSLSMVALYLTHDAQWTPVKVAEIAIENGYCVPGSGSSWTLISEGSHLLGLNARELPLDENKMKQELHAGHPIIVVVGEGDFTKNGHFMVITGYDDTGFYLNDPNSQENSSKTWTYDTLSWQIRNLWAISKA